LLTKQPDDNSGCLSDLPVSIPGNTSIDNSARFLERLAAAALILSVSRKGPGISSALAQLFSRPATMHKNANKRPRQAFRNREALRRPTPSGLVQDPGELCASPAELV
jgi:hypothetical protein